VIWTVTSSSSDSPREKATVYSFVKSFSSSHWSAIVPDEPTSSSRRESPRAADSMVTVAVIWLTSGPHAASTDPISTGCSWASASRVANAPPGSTSDASTRASSNRAGIRFLLIGH
jgi:hypothetical protein